MKTFDLSEKIALIIGGSQGIGFAIAKGLATAGATIIIANRNIESGQRAAKSLKKDGFQAVAIPTDITDRSSVESLISQIINDFKRIDILVNSAGAMVRKSVEDADDDLTAGIVPGKDDSAHNLDTRGLLLNGDTFLMGNN